MDSQVASYTNIGAPTFQISQLPKAPASSMPLLKWPGGKRALLSAMWDAFPRTFNRYFEPFAGGAALFFAIQPSTAVLSDVNPELINCYSEVRDNPEHVIRILRRMRNSSEDYYRIRASVPRTRAGMAARTIYLTTLAFNGIYRLNLDGAFNVPYGFKTHIKPCDAARICCASSVLKRATLRFGDFSQTLYDAGAGDFIYFDPPYTVAHGLNGFVKYNERIFSWDDQVRLAKFATELAAKGCHVVVSNADHASVKRLYAGFRIFTVKRHSVIAAASDHRRQISECLLVGGPDAG